VTLTLDPGMVITFFSSLIEYYLYTKFHRNRKNFLWTDGRTDGNLTPILLGQLPKFGSQPKKLPFLPCNAMLVLYMLSSTAHLSQGGTVPKWLNVG